MEDIQLLVYDLNDIRLAEEDYRDDLREACLSVALFEPAFKAKMALRIHEIVERAKNRQHKKVQHEDRRIGNDAASL